MTFYRDQRAAFNTRQACDKRDREARLVLWALAIVTFAVAVTQIPPAFERVAHETQEMMR